MKGSHAGPPTTFLERQRWADALMNERLRPRSDEALERNPYGLRRRDPRASSAMKPRITITVKIDVAAILSRIAFIVALFVS
jgi:hypothetical protein